MSNNGATGDFYPSFASGAQDTPTPESAVTPTTSPSGWDNVVAAVRSATKKRQELLLTLTADNMTPIWLDLRTKRYFSETPLDEFPEETINPKLYAKLIDPNDPPFPWVNWRSIDAILWTIGGKAFAKKRARWLILGERYSLVRWPNLTQISYGSDELNAVSMLANGLLTVEELALVARISVEESAELISTLSFMGVLRGTGAPRIPVKVAEAMTHGTPSSIEELQATPLPLADAPLEAELVEIPEEALILDEESANVLADADRFRQQIDRPAISSMSLPDLPEDIFTHHYDEEEAVEEAAPEENLPQEAPQDDYTEDYYQADTPAEVETSDDRLSKLQEEKDSKREQAASRFSSMPSFESILEAQNLEAAALDSVSEPTKPVEKEKSGGLFGLLKMKLGKK